jgi:2-oxoglutarate ferredoxin oxidoreductase subunit beta
MRAKDFEIMDKVTYDIAWCPGCGNFAILDAVKGALTELKLKPSEVVMVSGIGQAAKTPHYLKVNFFNGLHGRSLPVATAIKAMNPRLTVITESGDGCMYGEGGNHFIHAILRNPDVTMLAHNNMVYGLTKGQASPTSQIGFMTSVQVAVRGGVTNSPFNPIALAVALDASFVARAYIGDTDETKALIKKAILHKGFALVDIFQPCVTYNRVNTYQWYKENTYYLDDTHDPTDRIAAFSKAIETDKYPLGVIYKNPDKKTFEEASGVYKEERQPRFKSKLDKKKLTNEIQALKLR